MKKYTLYIVLGIVYLAGLIGALSFFDYPSKSVSISNTTETASETSVTDTTVIETETPERTDTERNTTETEMNETETAEVETTETEVTETEDTEMENTEMEDTETEIEDTEIEDTETESGEEYLNLPAVYNKGVYSNLRLNLRNAPSMSAQITGKCDYGDSLTVLSYIDDNWVMVEYKGETYYCSRIYLTVSE
jgi:uncharacterized protein YgiM (DUF1202 family)